MNEQNVQAPATTEETNVAAATSSENLTGPSPVETANTVTKEGDALVGEAEK